MKRLPACLLILLAAPVGGCASQRGAGESFLGGVLDCAVDSAFCMLLPNNDSPYEAEVRRMDEFERDFEKNR